MIVSRLLCQLVRGFYLCLMAYASILLVIDVKPDRANADKTVLVFKNDEVFQRELARINMEIAQAKAADEVL